MQSREHVFYGTATIGDKGQLVIPAEARHALQLASGDKLLVIGLGNEMVALTKLSQIEQVATHLSKKLSAIQAIISKLK